MKRSFIRIGGCIGTVLLAALSCGNQKQNASMDTSSEFSEAVENADVDIRVFDAGLNTPESILYDAVDDRYLVSNINGAAAEKDNNGFISVVSPTGEMVDATWIKGGTNGVILNAPKGMTIVDETFYVTDIDTVRAFHLHTGVSVANTDIPDATFLNDMCSLSNGTLFVSDSGSGAEGGIWRIKAGAAEKFLSGESLSNPNGLLCTPVDLWMVNGAGELIQIHLNGNNEPAIPLPVSGLDGIALTNDGTFIISSLDANAILSGTVEQPFETIQDNIPTPADLGYDPQRDRILVPLIEDDEVWIFNRE